MNDKELLECLFFYPNSQYTLAAAMALFSNGGFTSPDLPIFLLLLLFLLLSSLLNPLVFLHNLRKRPSLPRALFITLTVADFAACLIIPISFSVYLLAPKDTSYWDTTADVNCAEEYFACFRNATTVEKVVAVPLWTVTYAPSHITGFLAISRFYQIRFPLRPTSTKRVLLLLALTIIFTCGTMLTTLIGPGANIKPYSNKAWNNEPILYPSTLFSFLLTCSVTFIIQLLSCITSLFTIWDLYKIARTPVRSNTQSNSWKSSLKIILTNAGSVVVMIAFVVETINADTKTKLTLGSAIKMLLISTFIPIVLSAVNPIIYIVFTQDFFNRMTLKKKSPNAVSVLMLCPNAVSVTT